MMKAISLMATGRDTRLEDEARIVERARHDPGAFTLLYRRYLDPVYRYLAQRTADPVEAEDLTSQVFMDVLEGLVHYRDRGKFAAWLFTIAHRRLVDSYRRQHASISIDHPNDHDDGQEERQFTEDDLLEQVEQNEVLQQMHLLVKALPEERQELLRLRFAAGLSYEEMAAVLGRSPAALKMAVHRLLEQLQKSWQAAELNREKLSGGRHA